MVLLDRNAIIDRVRLAYRFSTGCEPTVVLLHGTPSHSFIWRNVVPGLEERGHGVLAYDLLGYGDSERPLDRDTSVTAQAALLDGLLAQLGIEEFVLVAHDIGGAIAQVFATEQPERVSRLMLIDPVSYDSWPSETWREIIRDHLDNHARMPQQEFETMLGRQLAMTLADPERMTGALLDAYLAPHRSSLGRASFFEHQVRHYDARPTLRAAARLESLSMPVRVLWGELDRWQPLHYGERLAREIPRAELITVADAGHFLMEDQPHRVVEEIDRLLAASM